jgi:hypothetical protein
VRLVVFHYHLLPGGVTQVIRSSALAALRYLPEVDRITLVTGKADNTDNLISEIKKNLVNSMSGKLDIDFSFIPEIGYISDQKTHPHVERIKTLLKERFEGCLWWIHNYHLGKNPFFTSAVIQLAEELPTQKIVLQIHDFPEASRFKNLKVLNKYITDNYYPVLSNIRYVTINNRDRKFLIASGVPDSIVFQLNNPVESLKLEENDEENYKDIDKILSGTEESYIKGAPLLIYPVRTIRRKNVLEAGLLARCCPIKVNLLPTLPGVSNDEKGYSKLVESCFKQKLLPGAAAAGVKLAKNDISFSKIMSAGKIIISSSVQEGFGYLFLNSLQWRKPLIARDIPVINDFNNIFSKDYSYFYDKVNIPLEDSLRTQLKFAYKEKLDTLQSFLSAGIISNLELQTVLLLQQDTIDFAYLSPKMQMDFLKKLIDPGIISETQKLNKTNIEEIERMVFIKNIRFDSETIDRFNLSSHGDQIKYIISSFNSKLAVNRATNNISENMISSFADFPSISLLNNPI